MFRRADGEPEPIAAITFSGFVIAAIGNTALFGFAFAAAKTAGQVPAEVTHTMSALGELFIVVFSLGMLVALLAMAIGARRSSVLPRWLAVASIAAAIPLLANCTPRRRERHSDESTPERGIRRRSRHVPRQQTSIHRHTSDRSPTRRALHRRTVCRPHVRPVPALRTFLGGTALTAMTLVNNEIKAAGDPWAIDAGHVRAGFREEWWRAWNIVRGETSTAAFACLAWSLVRYETADASAI